MFYFKSNIQNFLFILAYFVYSLRVGIAFTERNLDRATMSYSQPRQLAKQALPIKIEKER